MLVEATVGVDQEIATAGVRDRCNLRINAGNFGQGFQR